MASALSDKARAVLEGYLRLPLPGESSNCPYFNNDRLRLRMGLRAQIGKGSPQEIADEAILYSLREKVDLSRLRAEGLKRFLVDHNLGIDCSGFAYHVLCAESLARGEGSLSHYLNFPFANSPLTRLGRFLRQRYAENTDVKTFAHESNSGHITKEHVQAGDILTRTGGLGGLRDHIIVVTKVENVTIWIAQSEARPEDGRLGHGVREEVWNSTEGFEFRRLHRLS
jgi:hypothetical protein